MFFQGYLYKTYSAQSKRYRNPRKKKIRSLGDLSHRIIRYRLENNCGGFCAKREFGGREPEIVKLVLPLKPSLCRSNTD